MKKKPGVFTGIDENGVEIVYHDKKRHLWWLGFVGVFVNILTIWGYFALGHNAWILWLPAAYTYVISSVIDKILGEDTHNPPEAVVPDMMKDNYYRMHLYIHIPIYFITYFAFVWLVGTQDIPWWGIVALIIGVGSGSGSMLAYTHELGHKNNRLDRLTAKIGNTLMGYGHFNIEHNMGHHVWVSTPEDPASARMGESIYRFMLREIPGTIRRGLAQEKRRLAKKGHGFWSIHNEVLQVYAVTILMTVALAVIFGPKILWFVIPHHMMGWYALTQANYVEHYGLLRQKLANGKYEPCQPRHSWNTNHLWSNMGLLHLQRHSDHHANPMRPYHVLRDYEDVPSLPTGYGGCFLMAAFPFWWYKVMDKKVMEWAGGDITKVNVDPKKKDKLYRKYGATDGDMAAAE
ncbi:MAG TPA: alkane 1-monooxygenase [Hellea balneolensis]|uniref:Alkane 1-monooxygenase n=1 Tax=Hellea balneolensis TaxID=287478 RepID=A0A7V5U1F2_9PROT|nr:alkane 1-monooxygenase [Hellea balneolensis]